MMNGWNIMGSMPEKALFNFPPYNHPDPLAPAQLETSSIMRPFNIPQSWFTAALDARVPISMALLYAVTVKLLNRYNLAHGKKPWSISKTRPFFAFVVLHNVFLAVYSAWTFWGMLSGMRSTFASPFTSAGPAATADYLCRLQGPAGLGNSIYFDDETQSFTSLGHESSALVDGIPSPHQPGRLWNAGLAYYGWIFYLSKFYEVLDTFIILAKGKPSSTLQTYHHAGAMMCMWAGIRFMSAPIWVFVLVNSFIHALMYTYYTLTAFSIKVPVAIKRTLTSMQITQFLIGASYAMLHSFVSYEIPVVVTPGDSTTMGSPSAAADYALHTASARGALNTLRQLVLGSAKPGDAAAAASSSAPGVAGVNGMTTYVTQPCITNAGETFAIWLNVLYLAPLTYLFVSFFITSYLKRSNAASKLNGKGHGQRRLSNEVTMAEKAGWDAARGVEREIYNGENMVNGSAIDDSPRSGKGGNKTRRRA